MNLFENASDTCETFSSIEQIFCNGIGIFWNYFSLNSFVNFKMIIPDKLKTWQEPMASKLNNWLNWFFFLVLNSWKSPFAKISSPIHCSFGRQMVSSKENWVIVALSFIIVSIDDLNRIKCIVMNTTSFVLWTMFDFTQYIPYTNDESHAIYHREREA